MTQMNDSPIRIAGVGYGLSVPYSAPDPTESDDDSPRIDATPAADSLPAAGRRQRAMMTAPALTQCHTRRNTLTARLASHPAIGSRAGLHRPTSCCAWSHIRPAMPA